MASMEDIERSLTELLLAGKEMGAKQATASSPAAVQYTEQHAARLHYDLLRKIGLYALRQYEAGLELGRSSTLKASA